MIGISLAYLNLDWLNLNTRSLESIDRRNMKSTVMLLLIYVFHPPPPHIISLLLWLSWDGSPAPSHIHWIHPIVFTRKNYSIVQLCFWLLCFWLLCFNNYKQSKALLTQYVIDYIDIFIDIILFLSWFLQGEKAIILKASWKKLEHLLLKLG